ncbi:MAG: 4'-phosphopantetheinyl transferase superfamily protein [Neisseriaceae bacterium]|nr:4'-phosphopantetheinyl transferase superfamily protein [Neisseriaceae bacterium]
MINLNAAVFSPFGLATVPSPHPDIDLYGCPLSSLSLADDRLAYLQSLLTSAELTQRLAYRTDTLKANAILSRGLLRLILAEYGTDTHPKGIKLMQHRYGKPYLPNSTLQFSVSHCDSRLMIAVSRTRLIGIDIERLDQKNQGQLADFVLSPEELACHRQRPPSAQQAYFLQCWTRKEAYLKAIGTGLVNHLQRVDTSADYVVDQGRTTPYQACAVDLDQRHVASLVYA